MSTSTVSPKFQVVIPKSVRDAVGLEAGTVMEVIPYGSRIELIPVVPITTLKGRFKGIDTNIDRDDDRL